MVNRGQWQMDKNTCPGTARCIVFRDGVPVNMFSTQAYLAVNLNTLFHVEISDS